MIHKQIFINQPVQPEASPLMLHRKPGTCRLVPFIFLLLCFILPKPVSAQVDYPIFNDSSVWNVWYEEELPRQREEDPIVLRNFTISFGFWGLDTTYEDGTRCRDIYGVEGPDFFDSKPEDKFLAGKMCKKEGKIWAEDYLREWWPVYYIMDTTLKVGDVTGFMATDIQDSVATVLDSIDRITLQDGSTRLRYFFGAVTYRTGVNGPEITPIGIVSHVWVDGMGSFEGPVYNGGSFNFPKRLMFVKKFLCFKNGQSLVWQNPETFDRYGCYYEEPEQGDWPKLGTYWIYTVKENSGNNGDYLYTKYTAEKDTVLSGMNCRKITLTDHYLGRIQSFEPIFLKSVHDSVLVYSEQASKFLLLYDFEAKAGDTLTFATPSDFNLGQVTFDQKIATIDTLEINGKWLSYLQFEYFNPLDANFGFTSVVKGIGHRVGGLEALPITVGDIPILACFVTPDSAVYWDDKFCRELVSSIPNIKLEGVKVYPTLLSTSEPIVVDFSHSQIDFRELSIEVINTNGAVIQKQQLFPGSSERIQLHLLPEIHSGFYYLRVSDGNQASVIFKLVILK